MLVVGATLAEPPPGIERASDAVVLAYATGGEEVARRISEADAMFTWDVERAWLEDAWPNARRLRWIQSPSDGVDWLLFPDLVDSDVALTNARGVFDGAIAEWVIGAMLGFAARLFRQRDLRHARRWEHTKSERLEGSRLLIVGPGPIGRAVARRAADLGLHVNAVGRTPRKDPVLGSIRPVAELLDALPDADWVVDALPLTAETRHLFDRRAFASMKPSARFINVGRGGTVDEAALAEALETGELAGAALDVFETEPLPASSPLWGLPQVHVSPHMSGDFQGWEEEAVRVFVDNARRFAAGEPLRNLVDKVAGFGAAEPIGTGRSKERGAR